MKATIDKLQTQGHHFIELNQEEYARIQALHDCLIAVQEEELIVAGHVIDIDTARPYLRDYASQSECLSLSFIGFHKRVECIRGRNVARFRR